MFTQVAAQLNNRGPARQQATCPNCGRSINVHVGRKARDTRGLTYRPFTSAACRTCGMIYSGITR